MKSLNWKPLWGNVLVQVESVHIESFRCSLEDTAGPQNGPFCFSSQIFPCNGLILPKDRKWKHSVKSKGRNTNPHRTRPSPLFECPILPPRRSRSLSTMSLSSRSAPNLIRSVWRNAWTNVYQPPNTREGAYVIMRLPSGGCDPPQGEAQAAARTRRKRASWKGEERKGGTKSGSVTFHFTFIHSRLFIYSDFNINLGQIDVIVCSGNLW